MRNDNVLRVYDSHRRSTGRAEEEGVRGGGLSSSTGIKARCAIKRAMAPNAQRDVEPGPIARDCLCVIKQKWVNAARRDPCIRNDVDILNRLPPPQPRTMVVCCTLFLDAVLSSFLPGARALGAARRAIEG